MDLSRMSIIYLSFLNFASTPFLYGKWAKSLKISKCVTILLSSCLFVIIEAKYFPSIHILTYVAIFLILISHLVNHHDCKAEQRRIREFQLSIILAVKQNEHEELCELLQHSQIPWSKTVDVLNEGLAQSYETINMKTLTCILQHIGPHYCNMIGFAFANRPDILLLCLKETNYHLSGQMLGKFPFPQSLVINGRYPFYLEEIFDRVIVEKLIDPLVLKKYCGYDREVKKLV